MDDYLSKLQKVVPELDSRWLSAIQYCTLRWGIYPPKQLPAFLSNCLAEGGGMTLRRESLNYSVNGLLLTFSRSRISAADAQRLGRKAGEKALNEDRQRQIANLIYGGQWGAQNLGNTQPNDGWEFRGAPSMQLTGRANWTAYLKAARINVPMSEWVMTPEGALDNAGWFWNTRGCGDLAMRIPDRNGETSQAFEALARRINGGTIGLEHRQAYYRKVVGVFNS